MDLLFIILSFFLSLSFSGQQDTSVSDRLSGQCELLQSPEDRNVPADKALNRDICITSAQGWAFSGSENGNPVSVRSSQTGRRTSPSTKTTTRLVRTGKVIDTHNFNPFLSAVFLKAAGVQSLPRYIHAICCLRL